MRKKSVRFMAVDICYIAMMIIPILVAIVLKIMTAVPTEGIAITGAQIYFTLPLPIQDLPITEAQINSWMVIISVTGLCLYLTHGMCTKKLLIRQHIAEWIVEKVDRLVEDGMGSYFAGFSPFIAAMLGLSAFSSLLSLCGLFPPTSDLNVVAGWAVLVFVLITFYKCKAGPLEYIKSFANPVAMAPLNIISELATPLSMAFRHYGNVLSGTVISVLIAAGMQGLSRLVLGWIPGALGDFPLFRIGLPAVLSVYFDIFSGCLQAYIFAMLTMMYVSGGFPYEAYMERKNKRNKKKNLEVM